MKILVADRLSAEGLATLKSHPEFQVIEAAGKPRSEILSLVADADALIIRSETQADSQLLQAGKNLKVVGRAGVGVDNVDLLAAKAQNIVVMNTPAGNTTAAAELTFAHILNAFRPLVNAAETMRQGKWEKKTLMGSELEGKTLGVLGCGRIGSRVAGYALAFGMKVLAWDPHLTPARAAEMKITKAELEEIWPAADAITLHLPLVEATRFIINDDTLAKMKPGSRLINCARGELVHEGALIRALESGRLSHAGLDVFVEEPQKPNYPLMSKPTLTQKLALTPHLGASTHEAQARVGIEIAESVSEFLLTGRARNTISAL